jgi:hypothetical protein
MCPRCRGAMIVPTFAAHPRPPVCENDPHCREEPLAADLCESACEMAEDLFATDTDSTLAVRLSSNVGGYQSALLDGDKSAARSFLANVVALSEMLMKRLGE